MGDSARVAAHPLQLSAGLLDLVRLTGHLTAQGHQAAVPVENIHMCAGTEQIQMLPLSVDIDQPGGQFAQ